MKRHFALIIVSILSLFLPLCLYGQDTLGYENKKRFQSRVDSLLIDRDIYHWSIRAIASFKDNNFKLGNGSNTIRYTPTNRGGVGVCFLNSKFLLDLVFNINTNTEESTKRFDLQGNVLIKQELLLIQVQNYQGFNVENSSIDDSVSFRSDIRSFLTSLNYTHLFKEGIKTLHSLYSSINPNPKSVGTFLGGVYSSYQFVEADSSIIPESSREFFNEEAQIYKMTKFTVGLTGGYAFFLSLPKNFFALVTVSPGIGINFKSIKTETLSYSPSELLDLYLYANLALGYNGSQFYIELRDENIWYFSSLGNKNRGSMNSTKIKLSFGWKFKKSSSLN